MKIKESEIITLMQKGEHSLVMDHLYKKVFPKVKRHILSKRGKPEDVADVFQDCLVIFYKQVTSGSFNEKYTVYGYLFTMCHNRWLNLLRKTNRLSLIDTYQDESIGVEIPEIDLQPVAPKKKSLLETFFPDLGEKCLELLKYSFYKNLLMEDVALRMGIASVDAAKMQTSRCKQKLIKKLQENPELKARLQKAL